MVVVDTDKKTFDMYYNGCCNETFWPLFHSMPDRTTFIADNWKAYVKVNQIFADKALKALKMVVAEKTDDVTPIIWIHDYHLMLAANWIRQVN